MRTRRKIAVVGIFMLGGFTTITGIIRLHSLTYANSVLHDPHYSDVASRFPHHIGFILHLDLGTQTTMPPFSTGQLWK